MKIVVEIYAKNIKSDKEAIFFDGTITFSYQKITEAELDAVKDLQ